MYGEDLYYLHGMKNDVQIMKNILIRVERSLDKHSPQHIPWSFMSTIANITKSVFDCCYGVLTPSVDSTDVAIGAHLLMFSSLIYVGYKDVLLKKKGLDSILKQMKKNRKLVQFNPIPVPPPPPPPMNFHSNRLVFKKKSQATSTGDLSQYNMETSGEEKEEEVYYEVV